MPYGLWQNGDFEKSPKICICLKYHYAIFQMIITGILRKNIFTYFSVLLVSLNFGAWLLAGTTCELLPIAWGLMTHCYQTGVENLNQSGSGRGAGRVRLAADCQTPCGEHQDLQADETREVDKDKLVKSDMKIGQPSKQG